MTHGAWEIVGREDWKLPLDKSVGDAVRDLVRRRWQNNTAKHLERHWDLDPKTAKNVVGNGHVSERTLTKAIRAEGWSFVAALGEELTGQTYDQHLQNIIEETAREQEARERQRDRVRQMEVRARELGAVLSRPAA